MVFFFFLNVATFWRESTRSISRQTDNIAQNAQWVMFKVVENRQKILLGHPVDAIFLLFDFFLSIGLGVH